MCGIVGVAVNGPANIQMKEFFADLLFHDIVRGRHATGVAAVDTMKQLLTVEKRAVPADIFLGNQEIIDNLFAPKHDFNIYIGHNRYATQGAKEDDNNAHPFVHGDLVGVHNGTLRKQSLLDDHKDFVVDSDNLYHHMAKNGLDDTVTKLNGAFSLVWYDRSNSSLNFIRNEERPMAVGKLTNGAWVWASEMGMLRWLVSRHKTLSWATETEDKTTTQMLYNLEVGLHFSVPYKKGTRQMDLVKISKKTLPKFEVEYSRGNNYGGYYGTSGNTWDDRQGSSGSSRRGGNSKPHRSPHMIKGDEAVAKWLTGGSQLSSLEVEFMGHSNPTTSSGFVQKLCLFQYRNVKGKVIKLFAYSHAANICSTWTEADIGKKVFADISNATPVNNNSFKETITEGEDHIYSVWNLKLTKPNTSYYGFVEEGAVFVPKGETDAEIAARIDKMIATGLTQEGDTGNVVPFRQAQQAATTSCEEGSRQESVTEAIAKGELVEGGKVMIVVANELISLWRLKEYVKENHQACANCGGSLNKVPTTRLYIHEWFDRETTLTANYLTCRKACHTEMVQFTDMCDKDYDQKLGNIHE